MYGFEATSGRGGLAARAPANPYLARNLQVRDPGAMVIGDPTSGGRGPLPYSIGQIPGGGPPAISPGGGAVERNPGQQLGSWREIFDWHNSPAPWILLLILLLYGYVHVSYRRGRAGFRAGAGRAGVNLGAAL